MWRVRESLASMRWCRLLRGAAADRLSHLFPLTSLHITLPLPDTPFRYHESIQVCRSRSRYCPPRWHSKCSSKAICRLIGRTQHSLGLPCEVDAAKACDAAAYSYSDESVTKGLASVYPSFLKKIEKQIGHGTIHPTALEEAAHQVQTKRFTETTQLHRDSYFNEQGLRQGVGESDNGMVGFIFRNTNEDAHFETDADGGFCFPAVEGTFMSFDGSIPHQTIVKSGHVELIGPFLLSSKALFGVGDDSTGGPTTSPTYSDSQFPTFSPTLRLPTNPPTKAAKSPAAKSSKAEEEGISITAQKLASNQAPQSSLSFLIAGTVIVAAAALLNIALKWAQKSRQARSINDLDEAADVDGFEDEFEDEDVIVGQGVEIVETNY